MSVTKFNFFAFIIVLDLPHSLIELNTQKITLDVGFPELCNWESV